MLHSWTVEVFDYQVIKAKRSRVFEQQAAEQKEEYLGNEPESTFTKLANPVYESVFICVSTRHINGTSARHVHDCTIY